MMVGVQWQCCAVFDVTTRSRKSQKLLNPTVTEFRRLVSIISLGLRHHRSQENNK